jgi:hypothetical protein
MVFGVVFEMISEVVNTGGQQRDLYLRTSGVIFGALVLRHDFRLIQCGDGHVNLL